MKTTKQRKATVLAAALTFAGVGATSLSAALFWPRVPAAEAAHQQSNVSYSNGLRANLWTDRTQYPANRAVEIAMTLTNTNKSRTVVMLDGKFEYDILIRDSRTSKLVWQWSQNKRPSSSRVSLEAGETRQNREIWDRRDIQGKRVPSGVYTVEARIAPAPPVMTQIYLSDSSNRGGGANDDGDGSDNNNDGGGNSGKNPPPRFPKGDRPNLPPTQKPGDGFQPFDPRNPNSSSGGSDGAGQNEQAINAALQSFISVEPVRVRPGSAATIRYMVKNRGRQPITLSFSSSSQFDVTVYPVSASGGNGGGGNGNPENAPPASPDPTWRFSGDKAFLTVLTSLTLTPGESKTFTANWPVAANTPAGIYAVSAFLRPIGARDGAMGRASARVQVGGGTNEAANANSGDNSGSGDNSPLSVSALLAQGSAAIGKRVTVSGVYRGWRSGNGAPPVRRSDWVIAETDAQTIYISGPLPSTVRENERVTVTGIVRRARDGRLYLETQ